MWTLLKGGSDIGRGFAEVRQVSTLLKKSLKISAEEGDTSFGGLDPGFGFNLDRMWHIRGLAHH